MTMHTFAGEMERQAKESARFVEWYARRMGAIRPASLSEDRSGVDFWAEGLAGSTLGIQLKVDFRSDSPPFNFFIEWRIEYPFDGRCAPGWAQHLRAEEYWFVRPASEEAVCIGRETLGAWTSKTSGKISPIFGPVKNIDASGARWDAWGYLLSRREWQTMGTTHKLPPRPDFS